jgi:diguanylate cyclase (GGDEF)-like protein
MIEAKPRIVVADDDPRLAELLRNTLEDAGYHVFVADNGNELVRIAQNQVPDLLLIDLMMPLMDGFEAIRQLRNDTRTAHLPMIILTARGDSNEVVFGFDTGADDYITKPYDTDVLLARLRGHLRRAAQLPVRNPLTGLPGNMLLKTELQRLLDQHSRFCLLYIDLDNFKAFNDSYGFARGDQAIHTLANVLKSTANEHDFVGHIGGDDFAIIHHGAAVEQLCRRLILAFDQQIRQLYEPDDLARGSIESPDRHGTVRSFSLLSLSIAVVSTAWRDIATVDEMSKIAAELKRIAKGVPQSSYQFDQNHQSADSAPDHAANPSTGSVLPALATAPEQSLNGSARHPTGFRHVYEFWPYLEARFNAGDIGSIAVLDVDDFRAINATFTHHVGNSVLKRIADILQAHCRPDDIVAHYGGEEFALIFLETPLNEASGICERIRIAIAQADWFSINAELKVTISAGVADLREHSSPDAALASAELRLHEAKMSGKNQVRT